MIAFLILYAVGMTLAFALLATSSKRRKEQLHFAIEELKLVETFTRNNLRLVRARVSYGFPEAVAVCDALETTLQARCRLDADTLENRLIRLRQAHNGAVLAGKAPVPVPPTQDREFRGAEL